MAHIEIDFDVFKALTALRASEQESYNDVVRKLLDLPQKVGHVGEPKMNGRGWASKGVHFPSGTDFRMKYKGSVYHATVGEGALLLKGERFTSPSAAAGAITGTSVDGWIYWECRLPGEEQWRIIKSLRNSRAF